MQPLRVAQTLRATNVAMGVVVLGLITNHLVYCRVEGKCNRLPYFSLVGSAENRDISNLEITFLVALAALASSSMAQRYIVGSCSQARFVASLILVITVLLGMSFDVRRHYHAHFLLGNINFPIASFILLSSFGLYHVALWIGAVGIIYFANFRKSMKNSPVVRAIRYQFNTIFPNLLVLLFSGAIVVQNAQIANTFQSGCTFECAVP